MRQIVFAFLFIICYNYIIELEGRLYGMYLEEIWKDIKDYKGIYQVSNLGRVKSIARKVKHSRGNHSYYQYQQERLLSANQKSNGYLEYSLCKDSKRTHKYIHRLVADAFIDNPNNLPVVNHIDEDKQNNKVDNLEWCTVSYNNTYGTRIDRKVKNTDYRKNSRKIIGEKNNIRIVFYSIVAAKKITNINRSSIESVLSGRIKSSKGWYFYDAK